MAETLTREQSRKIARSIVRDAPWTKPGWPTQEEIDAFKQTDLGKAILRCKAEREAREKKEGYVRE